MVSSATVYSVALDLSSEKTEIYCLELTVSGVQELQYSSFVSYWQAAEIWQKLIEVKKEGGAEKAELHQLWKRMIQLLGDNVQYQDNKTAQLVKFLNSLHLVFLCTLLLDFRESLRKQKSMLLFLMDVEWY